MNKIKLTIVLLITIFIKMNAQYTTDYPFDSSWVKTFSGPVFNIKDLGAIPDDTINDSKYFRMAADSITKYGLGKIVIPTGLYIVGEQTINDDPNEPYYQVQKIFSVDGVNRVIVEGEDGAILKMSDGLHFGSFDPVNGEIFVPENGGFYDHNYIAHAGIIFSFVNSSNIIIKNLELDGNIDSYVIGGYWGDVGIQLHGIGVLLLDNSNVLLKDIYSHHHGLDGVEIGYYNLTEESLPTVHVLENVKSEYNGRQGLSWVGGIGLTAYNCKFNHTGKAKVSSPPGAGVDIEAEASIIRSGKFINCEFLNNSGCGLVADSGPGGYSTFDNCTFWGTTSWAMWNDKPKMVFNDCRFYGSIVHAFGSFEHPELATKYNNCHFEDKEHPEFGVYRSYLLINHDMVDGSNVTFDSCTIIANKLKSMWLTHHSEGQMYVKNTTITHKAIDVVPNNDFQAKYYNIYFENVQFLEDYPEDFESTYYINISGGVEVGNCVFVEGPIVKWRHWLDKTNPYGWILPGFHGMEQTVDVLSPDGGESWSVDSTYTILWDFDYPTDTIRIELYKGCQYFSTLTEETENDGVFQWTISDTLPSGHDYSINVLTENYPTDFAYSDTTFTINNIFLSIEEQETNIYSIFPNPAHNKLTIFRSYSNFSNKAVLSINDVMGRKIKEFTFSNYKDSSTMNIDLEKLKKGIYFLSIIENDKLFTSKFIKL